MFSTATVGGLMIEVVDGDITEQGGFDAIVNAANAALLPGAGVAGAIHAKAGPGLAVECRPLAPISTGSCVITAGHRLVNPFVIHCLGPVYADERDPQSLLARCHTEALRLAEERNLSSVAFPAISTGVFGYPLDEAAGVALSAVATAAPVLGSVHRVRFVLFGEAAFSTYATALAGLG